jgi:hypothetical protein
VSITCSHRRPVSTRVSCVNTRPNALYAHEGQFTHSARTMRPLMQPNNNNTSEVNDRSFQSLMLQDKMTGKGSRTMRLVLTTMAVAHAKSAKGRKRLTSLKDKAYEFCGDVSIESALELITRDLHDGAAQSVYDMRCLEMAPDKNSWFATSIKSDDLELPDDSDDELAGLESDSEDERATTADPLDHVPALCLHSILKPAIDYVTGVWFLRYLSCAVLLLCFSRIDMRTQPA